MVHRTDRGDPLHRGRAVLCTVFSCSARLPVREAPEARQTLARCVSAGHTPTHSPSTVGAAHSSNRSVPEFPSNENYIVDAVFNTPSGRWPRTIGHLPTKRPSSPSSQSPPPSSPSPRVSIRSSPISSSRPAHTASHRGPKSSPRPLPQSPLRPPYPTASTQIPRIHQTVLPPHTPDPKPPTHRAAPRENTT